MAFDNFSVNGLDSPDCDLTKLSDFYCNIFFFILKPDRAGSIITHAITKNQNDYDASEI